MNLWAERIVCRLIGCRSVFARWFEWHHGAVYRRVYWVWKDRWMPSELLEGTLIGLRESKAGKLHTLDDWDDLEADGIVCLGYANGRDGEHEHWPSPREVPSC